MLKKKKYVEISVAQQNEPFVPNGAFEKCVNCKQVIYQKLLGELKICPKCGYLHRLDCRVRIDSVVDSGTFVEFDENMVSKNPIQFEGYEKKIEFEQQKTGLKDAVMTGVGEIEGCMTCVGAMDSSFMMGSMGSVVGEKITRLFEHAVENRLPVVLFTCSGGARMQETIISLMQMAKVSCAVKRHSDAGLLYVTVLTDPTTGGVTASFAMQGDIILAEPKALIGFAGRRVIEETLKEQLPEDFQSSEFLKECGFVDAIVKREDMKNTLGTILKIHQAV